MGIWNAIYEHTYTGHFDSTTKPAKTLTIFIDGEEFAQIAEDYFECRYKNCKAKVYMGLVKDPFTGKYRFQSHAEEAAHNHSSAEHPET